MLNTKASHVYREITLPNGDRVSRLVEMHPILRLKGEHAEYPILIQDGQLYGDGGAVITEPPAWFYDEVRKCSPEALAAAGYTLPVASPGQGPPPTQHRYCDVCETGIAAKGWRAHLHGRKHRMNKQRLAANGNDHLYDAEPAQG